MALFEHSHNETPSHIRAGSIDIANGHSQYSHGLSGETPVVNSKNRPAQIYHTVQPSSTITPTPSESMTAEKTGNEETDYVRVNVVDGSAAVSAKAKVTVLVAYFFCNLVLTLSNKEILNFVSDQRARSSRSPISLSKGRRSFKSTVSRI